MGKTLMNALLFTGAIIITITLARLEMSIMDGICLQSVS